MYPEKIIPFDSAAAHFAGLRAQGKKIVHCHGTFDLVHPGHLIHLEEARALGDVLVVTLTSEKFVNKGPGRPYFNDQLRARSLAAIGFVDYVVLIPFSNSVAAIECVRPHIYCKGREYEDPSLDVTGNILEDVRAVESVGGEVRYLGSVVFSSSRLINNFFSHLPDPIKSFCGQLSRSVSPENFRDVINGFETLRVLVVGDVIFDRYATVRVQGLTSKNRIISSRFMEEDMQAGGSLAVYRHIKQFCPQTHLLSLAGTETWADAEIRRHVAGADDRIIRHEKFTTIIKHRFVEPIAEGKELSKLFSVNFIDAAPPAEEVVDLILSRLDRMLRDYDLVVVADFGHGLLQEKIRGLIQAQARFMALNCQTNSNNHGFNIITRQYHRADCFSLDEMEILLACARRHINHREELEKIRAGFGSGYAWLTRGGIETIGLDGKSDPVLLLPFETQVLDTVGAGDAFFSVAALSAKQGLPIGLATFIGQLAGGQAVKIFGNSKPISKQVLLKAGMTLLNH
ncbi:MAG: adenylyltransferase/cytidyltransferase family protein [Verrucomicrobiae bacterium]|nr:adenylyltransferase/cytidyltransferase family protein [Verrucomicrobiae bacterium]